MIAYLQAVYSSLYSFFSSLERASKASLHSLVVVESALLPRTAFFLHSQAPGAPQEKRINPAEIIENKKIGLLFLVFIVQIFVKKQKMI